MKKKHLLIVGLIILVAVIYISLTFNDSVWVDEGYTMLMLKKDFGNIIKATSIDVHPPLYYFIAKIFTMIFGYSVFSVKLASIVPVILTMIFVAIKSKKIFGKNAMLISTLFILLLGFSPIAFSMNIELRMYTWAMCFVTISGVYAYELYQNSNSRKSLVLFVLSSLCAAYTHYYAVVIECFVYLFLTIGLMMKNRKNWKICLYFILSTIILYLPWLPVFIKQFSVVKEGWWLTTFNAGTILSFIKYLFEGNFTNLFLILFATSIVSLIFYVKNNHKDQEGWFAIGCIFSFIMMVALGCIVSKLIRPMFLARYMYNGVGLLFLGISIAISKIEYKKLFRDLLISLVILNLPFSYGTAYSKEYKTGTENFKKFVKENITHSDKITSDMINLNQTVFPYYLPNNIIDGNINKNTRGYIITKQEIEKIKATIPNTEIDLVYSGDIDSAYYFNIYYIK